MKNFLVIGFSAVLLITVFSLSSETSPKKIYTSEDMPPYIGKTIITV